MMTPALRELIDSINNKNNVTLTYKYKDGKTAILRTRGRVVSVECDEPALLNVLQKLLDRALQGNLKGD